MKNDDEIENDSKEESYFEWFLSDLLKSGVIKNFRRADSYHLFGKVTQPWFEARSRKPRVRERTLKQPHIYTPDYHVIWEPEYEGVAYCVLGTTYVGDPRGRFVANRKEDGAVFSVFEVKGSDSRSSKFGDSKLREARLNIMATYTLHGIYTELVNVGNHSGGLFDRCFVPHRFFLTDKKTKVRKFANYEPRTVDQWIGDMKKNALTSL